MTTSEQINDLAAAMAKAQGEMEGALKSASNPFFKSKYPDLASVRDACVPYLSKYGLAVLQSPTSDGSRVSVETLLMHTSGQWVKDTLTATAKDDSPQSVGSAITYLRRYSLMSFAGVAAEDDDGEAAQGRGAVTKAAAVAVPEPKGYGEWLDAMRAKAMDGTSALQASWKVSKVEYRDYLLKTAPAQWDAMKAAAVKAAASA